MSLTEYPPDNCWTTWDLDFSDMPEYDDINILLKYLADVCIGARCYRHPDSNRYQSQHEFNQAQIALMNKKSKIKRMPKLTCGLMFLEREQYPPDDHTGFIRLYTRSANPKWSFSSKDGVIEVAFA